MNVYWWLANKRPTFRVEWEYQRENEVAVSIRDADREVFRTVLDASVLEDLEEEIHRFREQNGLIYEDENAEAKSA